VAQALCKARKCLKDSDGFQPPGSEILLDLEEALALRDGGWVEILAEDDSPGVSVSPPAPAGNRKERRGRRS